MSQNQIQHTSKTWSITSLAIGIASFFLGLAIVVPIAGIVVGVMAKRREPHARTMAKWGIGVNVFMLVSSVLVWLAFGGAILAGIDVGAATS